ncbi:uncharacterized protein LOC141617858 [Silene latifolia]|uniref:uncharacterized protein LOC141617858 n=1 Tax=Silene latifolia TaxID=37657 RepID=UPI003D7750ED
MEDAINKLSATMELMMTRMENIESKLTDSSVPSQSNLEKLFQFIEHRLKLAQGKSIHFENARTYTLVLDKLSANFALTDIPMFEGTEDPVHHVKSYKDYLALKGVPAEMLSKIFAQSLGTHLKAWFYNLDLKNFPTFKDVTVEFCRHYADNMEIQTPMGTLEVMTQKEKEGFTEFYSRWRGESVKLAKKPGEVEMVDMFINNLPPVYRNALKYHNFNYFKELARSGRKVKDDLRATEVEKPKGYPGSSSKSKALTTTNFVEAINALENGSKRPQRQSPRVFTDIGCTYAYALQRLMAQGKLKPIGPIPDIPVEQRKKL